MTLSEILEHSSHKSFLKADGFDDAVIGVDYTTDNLVYSIPKMIDMLTKDMEEDDAYEYLEYNVLSTYVGDNTPIFIWD